jgi:toxin ParE1/3/4
LRIELNADANADVRSIRAYTVRVYGDAQARRYIAGLRARMSVVAENPRIGRIYRGAEPETWRATYGQHFIYYRVEGEVLVIVRVLHQRMQQEGRLT